MNKFTKIWSTLKALLVATLVANGTEERNEFRADYTYFSAANGWFKMHGIPATWQDARMRCHNEGAVLSSPESGNLLDVMKQIIYSGTSRDVFTGISATYSKGDYYTVQGVPLTQFRKILSWAPNEPDNHNNSEDCLVMQPDGNMADAECSDVRPFMCFKAKSYDVLGECGTTDPEYKLDKRTGNCYKLHREPQVWARAFSACSAEGGYPVIIDSVQERQIVQELITNAKNNLLYAVGINFYVFLGITDWNERGLWRTVHGQRFERGLYNKVFLDINMNEHCSVMTDIGDFYSISCAKAYYFVCEKNPDSILGWNDTNLTSLQS